MAWKMLFEKSYGVSESELSSIKSKAVAKEHNTSITRSKRKNERDATNLATWADLRDTMLKANQKLIWLRVLSSSKAKSYKSILLQDIEEQKCSQKPCSPVSALCAAYFVVQRYRRIVCGISALSTDESGKYSYLTGK